MIGKQNGSPLVRILVIVALAATVIGCLNHLFYYEYVTPLMSDSDGYYRFGIYSWSEWSAEGVGILALTLAPSVLLTVYAWKNKGKQDAWLLGGIFAVYALSFAVFDLESFRTYLEFAAVSGTTLEVVLEWALEIAAAVLCVLAAISAGKGFRTKYFAILAMIAYLVLTVLDLNSVGTSLEYYTENKMYFDLVTYFSGTLGKIWVYLLVITCVNRFASVRFKSQSKTKRK